MEKNIESQRRTFLNILLDIDSTLVQYVLRNVANESFFKCQNQAGSYVTYFVLWRVDI